MGKAATEAGGGAEGGGLRRDLSYFDLTNLVVGAIIGSDIYIASAITAGLIGPLSLAAWVVAGGMATVLALVLAYSSYHVPRVGGVFAFISTAFDDFFGFLGGWSMWIAEVLSLPVFAITFVNYLQFFVPLNFTLAALVKAAFIFSLAWVNIVGVKAAGRVNDVLTLAKLSPLFLLTAVGLGTLALHPALLVNYTPFAPQGFGDFGTALVLIFWAYAGFELATLPASEVKNPRKTVPRAIITGMAIVTVFYLLTNFVVFGTVSSDQLARSQVPLILVGGALLGAVGGALMSAGGMVSVSGSDECGFLGTARLSYAMSIDGLFPRVFSKVHPKYKTPYVALIIQGIISFLLSLFSGLSTLISFSVFNLAFTFLLACLALTILRRRGGGSKRLRGERVLPWIGVAVCLYLLYSTSLFDKLAGSALILVGIPIYVYLSPKVDMYQLKELFVSEGAVMTRAMEGNRKFLANFLRLLRRVLRKWRGA